MALKGEKQPKQDVYFADLGRRKTMRTAAFLAIIPQLYEDRPKRKSVINSLFIFSLLRSLEWYFVYGKKEVTNINLSCHPDKTVYITDLFTLESIPSRLNNIITAMEGTPAFMDLSKVELAELVKFRKGAVKFVEKLYDESTPTK